MNTEFQKALDKKRILKFPQGKKLIKKELAQANDDLNEATDRFKNNVISGLVYNIRVKKYGERTQLIKEELPVLEARLSKKKIKKKRKK